MKLQIRVKYEINFTQNNEGNVLASIKYMISGVMPRSRFRQILRFLHINSFNSSQVTTTPNYDWLYKVRKMLDIIHYTSHIYTTHQEVSIDEAIPFQRGWVSNNT